MKNSSFDGKRSSVTYMGNDAVSPWVGIEIYNIFIQHKVLSEMKLASVGMNLGNQSAVKLR
jgi:hypothetical protein